MSAEPIDHRAIIASLSASDRAVLTGLTNRDGAIRFAVHFGAILLLGTAIVAAVPLWPLLCPCRASSSSSCSPQCMKPSTARRSDRRG